VPALHHCRYRLDALPDVQPSVTIKIVMIDIGLL